MAREAKTEWEKYQGRLSFVAAKTCCRNNCNAGQPTRNELKLGHYTEHFSQSCQWRTLYLVLMVARKTRQKTRIEFYSFPVSNVTRYYLKKMRRVQYIQWIWRTRSTGHGGSVEATGIPGTAPPHKCPTRSNTDLASFFVLLSQFDVRAAPVPPVWVSLVSWRADRSDFGILMGKGPPAQPWDETYLEKQRGIEISADWLPPFSWSHWGFRCSNPWQTKK